MDNELILNFDDRVKDSLEYILSFSLFLGEDSDITVLEEVSKFLVEQEERLRILLFGFAFVEIKVANLSLSLG